MILLFGNKPRKIAKPSSKGGKMILTPAPEADNKSSKSSKRSHRSRVPFRLSGCKTRKSVKPISKKSLGNNCLGFSKALFVLVFCALLAGMGFLVYKSLGKDVYVKKVLYSVVNSNDNTINQTSGAHSTNVICLDQKATVVKSNKHMSVNRQEAQNCSLVNDQGVNVASVPTATPEHNVQSPATRVRSVSPSSPPPSPPPPLPPSPTPPPTSPPSPPPIEPPPVPTLNVSLTANPSSGDWPLNNVSLTASVSGTASGSITYDFSCGTGGRDVIVSDSTTVSTGPGLCSYATPGTYSARVIVTRQGLTRSATASITVTG